MEQANHVCFRYRVQSFMPTWEENSVHAEGYPIARGFTGFLRQLNELHTADIVILQRRLLPLWKIALLRRACNVLLFDVDDAVFLRDSNSARSARSSRRWRRFCWTTRHSDGVLAGNHYLVNRARETGPTVRAHYIPTCIDVARYSLAKHVRGDHPARLVWIGSRSTLPSIEAAGDRLRSASQRIPGLTLRVICDAVPAIEGLKIVACPWSEATECRNLAESDIGISYLPDHPWSLGKCGLKVLQYMAAGLPVVANPAGAHVEMIEHGRTGFLCETPQEWADAIGTLVSSPGLRTEMGHRARTVVASRYSTRQYAHHLLEIFRQLTGGTNRQSNSLAAPALVDAGS
jgi:glycosyltransferase involved in cell wall biosynthesis